MKDWKNFTGGGLIMPVRTYNSTRSGNQLIFHEEWTELPAPPGAEAELVVSSRSDRVLVLDTAPIAGNSQPIDTFGRGFYGPECDSSGKGDRWTNGRGHAYFFTRLEVSEICLDFFSPFPDGTRLEMVLSRQDDPVKHSFVNEMHAEFWGKCNDVSRLVIPLKLQPATLYRLTLISPVFATGQAGKPGDGVGLAVVSAELLGCPFPATADVETAEAAEPAPNEQSGQQSRVSLQPANCLMPVRQITITGDITRPYAEGDLHQRSNIAWFWRLLQYPVTRAVGSFPVGQLGGTSEGSPVWRSLYDCTGYSTSEADWVRLYSRTSLEPECLKLLDRTYAGSLVLGFGLPDVFLRYFQHRGIPYIDAILHPARFLDDVFLAFRTNVPQAFESLRTYAIPEEQLYVQAGIHAATVARMGPLAAPANSCLLLGQTRFDKSLIQENRRLSLDDFRDDLRRLAGEHSRIYFKRHPQACEDPAIVEQLRQEGVLQTTEANIYSLFCSENISKVVSISSGASYEAQCFGKQTQYLYRPSCQLANESSAFDPWAYIGVYDAFYTPRFWTDLLAPVCPVDNCPEISLPRKTSRLRTSLQSYWGYNFLDHDILLNHGQGQENADR
jgi:hypothetical protein